MNTGRATVWQASHLRHLPLPLELDVSHQKLSLHRVRVRQQLVCPPRAHRDNSHDVNDYIGE